MVRPMRPVPGFSLIELMTVLLIMGLLLTVAWPSYQGHVRRANRMEAVAALLEAHQFMERYYAVRRQIHPAGGSAGEPGRRCLRQPHPGEHGAQGPHRQRPDGAAVLAVKAVPGRFSA